MRRILLKIAYDGTNYHGWQAQKTDPMTIEGQLIAALGKLIPGEAESLQIIGASRTDAGVHARGNAAVFDTECTIPAANFPSALNSKLPADIRVIKAQEVPEDFHPRYVPHEKRYIYRIDNQKIFDPIGGRYRYNFTYPLNLDLLRQAAMRMLGEHDFTSFVNPDSQVFQHGGDAVRTVYDINIRAVYEPLDGVAPVQITLDAEAGPKTADVKSESLKDSFISDAHQYREIEIEITGSGFLYHQIRIMVGTLLWAGIGKIKPEEIDTIMEAKDRTKAGPTVPACGLMLQELRYPEIEKGRETKDE